MAPVTPARKAYRQLKSMISNLKSTKTSQVATMLGQAQSQRHEMASTLHNVLTVITIQVDEFYGWAQVAKTSARFISTLLNCPETLLSTDPGETHPDLAHYIALSLHRSRLPLCVHQYALYLIWRVKCLNPEFRPKHAHGTYLTALMLAAKQSYDGVYSLNDWVTIGQDIFEPSQLRDNEWRMCERLEWKFLVHPMDLVKLAWTVEVEYGELDEGAPASSSIASETGLGGILEDSVWATHPPSHTRGRARLRYNPRCSAVAGVPPNLTGLGLVG
ncbi:cyclin, putative, partial [Rhizoctonia solani AG-3 Rhs1AP]